MESRLRSSDLNEAIFGYQARQRARYVSPDQVPEGSIIGPPMPEEILKGMGQLLSRAPEGYWLRLLPLRWRRLFVCVTSSSSKNNNNNKLELELEESLCFESFVHGDSVSLVFRKDSFLDSINISINYQQRYLDAAKCQLQ